MLHPLIRYMNKFLRTNAYDYCCIEANSELDEHTLVTKEGGLMTMFEVLGTSNIVGNHLFNSKLETILSGLDGNVRNSGHKIQWTFTRDNSTSRDLIESNINPMIKTMKRLGLSLEALLEERTKVLSEKVCNEKAYLVLTTMPVCLPKDESKRVFGDRIEKARKLGTTISPGAYGMSPFFEVEGLFDSHSSFVGAVELELSTSTSVKKLTAHEAITSVRQEIVPELTSPEWSPQLLGDKVSPRMMKEVPDKLDLSHVLNVPISFQLFPTCPEEVSDDATLVEMGNRYYAPLMVDVGPQKIESFNVLFNKIPANVPWRWSFMMHTGHSQILGKIKTKKSYATWLALTNSQNQLIKEAASELIYFGEKKNEVLCVGQMVVTTWGDTPKEARKNRAYLMKAMQAWGVEVIEERGDSVEAYMNTLPAVSSKFIANQIPYLLSDAIKMTPLFRPKPPWDNGNHLFRTKDKKLYPHMTGSPQQENWVSIKYAPPGKGKSFLMCAENMAHILKPGNTVLPRISILDIGYSSGAFVKLIRSALPDDKKHLAEAFRMQNNRDYAINPFDLPLGCYRPLAIDRDYLINLMTILLTPAGAAEAPEMLNEIVGLLINAMYDHFAPDGEPFKYEQGEDEAVDNAIVAHGLEVKEDITTWYEVRDKLFREKDYINATRAQRFAVPTIEDANIVLSENHSLKAKFNSEKGQALLATLKLMIQSATTDYPVMTNRTKFDIGNARIVSMDLQDVTPSNSAKADKQTGLMYMLARFALCKDFYRNEDNVMEIPEEFRTYHLKNIEADSQVPKKLCMDEIHRTKNCPMVRVQMLQDAREGRKHDILVTLCSQFLADFDDEMIKIANNKYILSVGNEDVMNEVRKRYNPSQDTIAAVRRYLRGPTQEGSDFLYIGNIKGQSEPVEMVLLLTVGAQEAWAYSTTKQDVLLREELVKVVGLNNALRILAAEFPGFTAAKYIQSRREDDDIYEGCNVQSIISNELIQKHRSLLQVA